MSDDRYNMSPSSAPCTETPIDPTTAKHGPHVFPEFNGDTWTTMTCEHCGRLWVTIRQDLIIQAQELRATEKRRRGRKGRGIPRGTRSQHTR